MRIIVFFLSKLIIYIQFKIDFHVENLLDLFVQNKFINAMNTELTQLSQRIEHVLYVHIIIMFVSIRLIC